ncbi:MAG: hypothetical protein JO214_16025 [Frankiaceae bacterium]|nr:hypothetical protein [Frankiaceae bacterium]
MSVAIDHFEGVNFRINMATYLKGKFGADCDTSGSTAIELAENSGRVRADIVPSYSHVMYCYDPWGRVATHEGQIVYRTDGTTVINYPDQQLRNGIQKNKDTATRYKQLVRILKRLENDLVDAGRMNALPSYFMECLMYRVPNDRFGDASASGLSVDLRRCIAYIFAAADDGSAERWLEPNEIKPLFGNGQKWSSADARQLALEVWIKLKLDDI